MSISERKSFGFALLIWLFSGGIRGHRIYIKERVTIILWYWLACMATFGIIWIIDLFLIKSWVDKANYQYKNSY